MWKCCPCFSKTYEAPEVLELDYRHSSLNEVPADVFTFERTLEKLDLGSNQISDLPPSLFHCHELKELDLCDNDLMAIPPAVGSLTRLCKLDLSRNAITDIADTIKNCKSLVYFDLSMNHLTKLPEGISQLVNLEELFLNDTYLEFLHANFGRLTKLKVLELRENSIQSLPKSMSRLHNLQRLDVGQNDLSELPEVVGTMTNMTELWCDNNSMRSIPKFIGNLTKLNCLDASQNEIQEIADEISKCTQLGDVTLNTNSLENLPDSFAKLENLTVLRLDSNSIQYLPEEFGNLKNLTELSIVSNILKTLPASIGLLRKLHTVYLDDNLLSELPKEIGSCTALSVFSVAKNQLKEIPSEVGHLSSLKVLTLSGNLIVHLPVSILNIPKLGALWLSESQSKPLLPLNKEIDPATGQHVLTCYLLPQLPSTGEETRKLEEDKNEVLPRRSRPSIKFVTDMDPPVVETNMNKRGLLRAPTPYPKELRALAKHASHLRQTKELNGEVVNTDEPEYDGDYTEEELNQQLQPGVAEARNSLSSTRVLSVQEPQRTFNQPINISDERQEQGPSQPSYQSNSISNQNGSNRLQYNNKDEIGLPTIPISSLSKGFSTNSNLSYTKSTSSASGPPPQSNTYSSELMNQDTEAALRKDITSAGDTQMRFSGVSVDRPDKATRETYGVSNSEMARKSPPPYHVAARRAAFFRSSGGAGSGRIGSGSPTPDTQVPARMSPIIGRVFPLTVPGDNIIRNIPPPTVSSVSATTSTISASYCRPVNNSEELNENPMNASQNSEIDAEEYHQEESDFNKTYTIAKDIVNDDSDVVSSMEENLNDGATLELTEGTVVDSKNIAETIETALESVDKRTTEFLRNDGWKNEDVKENLSAVLSSQSEGEFSTASSKVFNSVSMQKTELLDVDSSSKQPRMTTYSSGIPSITSIPSAITNYSSKGPTVPPKPSPLMSRNESTSSGVSSSRPAVENKSLIASPALTASTSLSKMDSFSKIPTFSTSSKSFSGHLSQLPSDISSGGTQLPSISPAHKTSVPEYSSNNNEIYTPSNPVGSNSIGSRIPKLPSFTNNLPQASPVAAPESPSHQYQFKKPDVLGPKPVLSRTIVTPSRIPSFGAGDFKIKDTNVESNTVTSRNVVLPQPSPAASSIISPGGRSSNQPSPSNNSNIPTCSGGSNTKIPRFGEPSPEKQDLKRSTSGTRIPKLNEPTSSRTSSPAPPSIGVDTTDNTGTLPENNTNNSSSLTNIPVPGSMGSKIPSFGNRKPWIFGTHRNARVVPVEFRKTNSLGFTVSDSPGASSDGKGVYVVATDTLDSTVKVGDKILQVDGIDVSNMGLEIVKKILGNCQENINLLVSRQS